MDYANNTIIKTDKIIKLQENKSTCIFNNPNQISISVVKVDGGLITDNHQSKCDYLLHWQKEKESNKLEQVVFFVELKGGDIEKAFEQLNNTIQLTKQKFAEFQQKHCVVVCTKVAPQLNPTIQKFQKIMKKQGFNLQVKSLKYEYDIK